MSMKEENDTKQEDNIYNILRTDILDLKLKPGLIFSIKDLSAAYQAGRSPVRDALISLQKEGLITFLPQRGTMISKLNYEKVANERFMRTCLEEQVILEFMASCSLESITKLELSILRQEELYEAGDVRAFLAEDLYFHSIFYYGANKGHCHDILSANSGHYRRIRILAMSEEGMNKKELEDHKTLLDAVLEKDSALLNRTLEHHLRRPLNQEQRLITKYPGVFEQAEPLIKPVPNDLVADFLVEAKLKSQL